MANIVLCFDSVVGRTSNNYASNTQIVQELLDESGDQIIWRPMDPGDTHARHMLSHREAIIEVARNTVIAAYRFLLDHRRPGDRIFVFGAGRDAYCARALTRLLGTVGAQSDRSNDLVDYFLATYALPRRKRTEREWRRVKEIVSELTGKSEIAVAVDYLGLWDTLRLPGMPSMENAGPQSNVLAARHAAAIDGGPFGDRLLPDTVDGEHDPRDHSGGPASREQEEVWFRGTHRDVAGRRRACRPLADIALDWVLDGAIKAGLALREQNGRLAPAPTECDALAGSAHAISLRRLPPRPQVHASVQVFLREHTGYRRRLPTQFDWVDPDWGARGERLAPPTQTRAASAALAVAS